MATTETFNGLFDLGTTMPTGTFTISNTTTNLIAGSQGTETVTYTTNPIAAGDTVTATSPKATGLGTTASPATLTFKASLQNSAGAYTGVIFYDAATGHYYLATITDTGSTYHGGSPTGSATGTSSVTAQPSVGWNFQGTTGTPACFMAGTAVRTPAGDVAVETLKAGDLVTLADGGTAPVSWIGIATVSTRFAEPERALPIRVKQDALGAGLPARDLLLSADHALFMDGLLVQAGALINGTSIFREANVPEVFSYYHVEVADHALILAENLPAETFVDNVSRMAFDNWQEHRALFGDACEVPEMDYPRAKSARQLPAALLARLGIGLSVAEAA